MCTHTSPLLSAAAMLVPSRWCGPHAPLRPSQALIHGLNRHYYSIALSYRKNELEQQMLMNLHKKTWTAGLKAPHRHSACPPAGFPPSLLSC